jgi:hypothetical protein
MDEQRVLPDAVDLAQQQARGIQRLPGRGQRWGFDYQAMPVTVNSAISRWNASNDATLGTVQP